MTNKYIYTAIFQEKADPTNYFMPKIIAFTKQDLNRQIILKRLDGFRYIRTVQVIPDKLTDLHPMMPDMALNPGKAAE